MRYRIAALALVGLCTPWTAALTDSLPGFDEARVEALIDACGEAKAEVLLDRRLARHGVPKPKAEPDPALGLAVDRALAPEENPEKSRRSLSSLWSDSQDRPQRRAAIRYFALKTLAFYDSLNCTGIKQWYGHLIVYRDLLDKAEASDPNRDYFARSVDTFRHKLAVMLRARRRLAEKEAVALDVLGLGGQ